MSYAILVGLCALGIAYGRPDGYSNFENPLGEPLVQKHIYVHVPPPDPEFHAPPQRVVPAPPPKKHYKIVFIKAPTYSPPQAPVIPELQQHQEKTLIYVLHKNPSDAPPIVIPTAKPTQPSKPEVYFIRYKTQKEVGYGGGPEHETSFNIPSSTAGYLGSTAGAYVSSTLRPHIRAHRTPSPTARPSASASTAASSSSSSAHD
ncbi:uncharacterized protein [Rhodnius prolixus]|uniref:uncharacterized protein n=1 Tax=Rhodnius prolixus TaxID=13249 RepID=UPI003D18E13C